MHDKPVNKIRGPTLHHQLLQEEMVKNMAKWLFHILAFKNSMQFVQKKTYSPGEEVNCGQHNTEMEVAPE